MSPQTRTVWLIRHGNRRDFVDPAWMDTAERPHDTPLSEDGEQQATETGRRLQQEKVDHVFASPFLRTTQTASLIALELNIPVKIEAGLAEMFLARWFPTNPDLPSAESLRRDFPRIDTSYQSAVFPKYPETEDDVSIRIAATIGSIMKNFDGNLALVAHGGSISALAKHVSPGHSVAPTFCCLIEYLWEDGRWSLVKDGSDNSHLTQDKKDLRFF